MECFQKGQVLLGLFLASEDLQELECLKRSLQSKTVSVPGRLAAIDCVRKTIQVKRYDEKLNQIYTTVCEKIRELDIQTIQMPHICRSPKRYTGNAPAFTPTSTEEYFRSELLDAVNVHMVERFDQYSFHTFSKLERVLISGQLENVVSCYQVLNQNSLQVHLSVFKLQYPCNTVTAEAETLRATLPEVILPEVYSHKSRFWSGYFSLCCALKLKLKEALMP